SSIWLMRPQRQISPSPAGAGHDRGGVGSPPNENHCELRYQQQAVDREAHSLAASPPTPEERPVILQHSVRAVMKTLPPKPAARSRLIIGHFGSSDSALAASSGWRLRRTAADRHATRCASRNLCSGGAPRRYPPSLVRRRVELPDRASP